MKETSEFIAACGEKTVTHKIFRILYYRNQWECIVTLQKSCL